MNILDNIKSDLMWSVYGDPKEKRSFDEPENFQKSRFLEIDFVSGNRAVGIDISKWDVFYKRDLVTTQQDFVIIRTSYGMKTDQKYFEFLPEVMKCPIRGAYHYMSSWDNSWQKQADKFLDLVSKGDFHFLVVDFESAGGNVLSNQFVGMTVEFAKYCQVKSGKKVVLYTGGYLFRDWIMRYQPVYAKTAPLWIAQYPYTIPNPQTSNPSMLKEIKIPWLLWQFSGDKNTFGKENGVGVTAVDVNVFNGSVDDMKSYFGIGDDTIPPIEPPIIIPNPNIVKVNSNMNIRNGAGVKYEAIDSLPANSSVEVLEYRKISVNEVWCRIDSFHWICLLLNGFYYSDKKNFSDIPIYVEPPVVVPPVVTTGKFIETFTVPTYGLYYQTLHDYENGNWDNTPRSITMNYKDGVSSALPETVPLLNKKNQFYPLSEEWQFWWFALLRKACYNSFSEKELLRAWGSLTADSRAFTDNNSIQNGRTDFVQRINIGAKKPMAIKALTTGGNIVKVLGVNGRILTIECLNFSKSPPSIDDVWEKKIWLYQWAQSETIMRLPNRTYRTSPFPQLNPFGSPVPVGSFDGTQKIDISYVKKLENGKTYRIYNP